MRKSDVLALAVIALTGVWHLATFRAGHEWGDDFGLYVQHARNLAEGRAYADTGYIYNPHLPALSPRTYPPVLPALLAPVYRIFGLDLLAMKVELTLLFLAFLAVLYLGWRRDLPGPWLPAAVLLLGFSPYLWDYKDRLLSEVPFLLFTYLALFWLRLLDEAPAERGGRRPLLAIGAGVLLYLACGTRSVGVVLVPALVLHQLLKAGTLPRRFAAALAVFAACLLAQKALLPFDGSYFDQLVFSPALFAHNLVGNVKGLGAFWDNGYSNPLRLVVYAALAVPAAVGYLTCLRRRFTAAEVFVLFYVLAITVWPSAGGNARFLLPVLPLFLVYAGHGLSLLAEIAGRRPALAGAAALALAVLASYAACYTRAEFGALSEGVGKPESAELFRFIAHETAPDDVFLFQKPRALALFTGRRASAVHRTADDGQLWGYLTRIGVTHVVVGRVFSDSRALLEPFVRRYPGRLEPVFRNADFTVYRVRTLEPDAAALAGR